jgi:Domain of Unknown Function (DUF1259)
MRAAHVLAICTITIIGTPAGAQTIDWKKVDEAAGRSAAVSGDVHRYGFPRMDLQVTLDGVTIKPAFALDVLVPGNNVQLRGDGSLSLDAVLRSPINRKIEHMRP